MLVQPSPVYCVSIRTILSTLCLYQHHQLFANSILFSGNVLVSWLFISGSSYLHYPVFTRIIASFSPLISLLNGPSHLPHVYLVLLYRECSRSSIMQFYPDCSLFFPSTLNLCFHLDHLFWVLSYLHPEYHPLSLPRILPDLSVV